MAMINLEETRHTLIDTKRLLLTCAGIALLSLSLAITAFAAPHQSDQIFPQADPMQDKYSQEIRDEFAKCRTEESPMSQFFCSCRVLEKQCEAPRRLQHGDWNTVEFWPSNEEAEREVQFILFMDYDVLGEFAPLETGIVLTCMQGKSDFNVFLGENVDPNIKPDVLLDDTRYSAHFEDEEGDIVLNFDDTKKVFKALGGSDEISVTYTDMDNVERVLEFNTFGFEAVSTGWETLCFSPES